MFYPKKFITLTFHTMPEIKSVHSQERIAEYMQDNQLDILNHVQIAAKFLELETRLEAVEEDAWKYRELSK